MAVGDELELGPQRLAVEVIELVGDVTQGAPTVWVNPTTYREIATTANPAAALPDGSANALVVETGSSADAATVAERIDAATAATTTVTTAEAIAALDVVAQQFSTFQGIIGVTFVVSLLVVVLFFVLITLERTTLYTVLKALGGQSLICSRVSRCRRWAWRSPRSSWAGCWRWRSWLCRPPTCRCASSRSGSRRSPGVRCSPRSWAHS
ncbi:MAG: hypothetical protein ACR2MA_01115 [Egibacteraceae bacterium]